MKIKLKKCKNCKIEKIIWKKTSDGLFCKSCWFKLNPVKIKQKSFKRKVEEKEYSKLRKEFLETHPNCQAKLPGCTFYSTDVHHMEKRGINYLNVTSWLSACRICHSWIELNKKEARELGFLK
jgi:hypothetical protein